MDNPHLEKEEMKTKIINSINEVKDQIKKLASDNKPRLVVVSKLKPASYIQMAYDPPSNHRHFGENYVQELIDKSHTLPADIKWHFIGHLQSNKCRALVKIPNLWVVETVDTQKLATQLNKAVESENKLNNNLDNKLQVFVQVNTSNEESKSGCSTKECVNLYSYIINKCPSLSLTGLMTIGKLDSNPQAAIDCYRLLVRCRENVSKDTGIPISDIELSMGMSGCYEHALRLGSTNIRCGSNILGLRPKKKKQEDNTSLQIE